MAPTTLGSRPPTGLWTVSQRLVYPTALENPPKIANNAKNIEIGKMLITVHAIDFALVHAVLPSALVVAFGQSMACSTSE